MAQKALLVILALFFFPFAGEASEKNYFYAGIEGGYDITNFYKTLTIFSNGTNLYDKKDDLTGTGNFVEGELGYQWNFDKMFLATEFSGQLSDLKYQAYYVDHTREEASRGKFTLDNNVELSLLPGFFFDKSVNIYGKMGVAKGSFNYAEYKDDKNSQNIGLTEQKFLYGFLYGLGTLFSLSKHMNLRLEYDHIVYQTYTNNTFPVSEGQVRTIKLKPTSNQFKIGFIYAF